MLTLRRSTDRRRDQRGRHEILQTFRATDETDPLRDGFGSLALLNENHLPPGAAMLRSSHEDAEILTYVRDGSLAYEDSMRGSGVLHTGEFQRVTARRGIHHTETNASRSHPAHVFQLWLCPSEHEFQSHREHKRFSTAERHGRLCTVASPDARRGSLRIHQDALIYSAILDRGQHVIHELSPNRCAWLHLVHGAGTLGDLTLTTGDGTGIKGERAVSLTAREKTEILLVDLADTPRST